MRLSSISLALNRPGAVATLEQQVASLFASGEQGAWYDPSAANVTWRRNLLTSTDTLPQSAAIKGFRVLGTVPKGVPVVVSFYVKRTLGAGRTFGVDSDNAAPSYGNIDTSTLPLNTWTRVEVTATTVSTASENFVDIASGGLGVVSYTTGKTAPDNTATATEITDGTYTHEFWGAQLERGTTATPYQRIVTPEITYLADVQAQPLLFQDSTGATPVTGVEQPVGLILDKRKGATLGAELVDTANTAAAWSQIVGAPTISQDGDAVKIVGTGANQIAQVTLSQAGGLSADVSASKFYLVTYEVKVSSGASVGVAFTTTTVAPVQQTITSTSYATYSQYVLPSSTSFAIRVAVIDNAEEVWIRNISVRLLDGNHAYQTGSTARPVLRARYNLLTYSEQFDNAGWIKGGMLAFGSGSTANATAAPDGTTTADLLTETNASTNHFVEQSAATGTANAQYTVSFYVKPNGRRYATVVLSGATANEYAATTFDLQSDPPAATKTGNGSSGTYVANSISAAANGFLRISVTGSITGTSLIPALRLSDSATPTYGAYGTTSYQGDGTSGMYIWGASLRVGTSAGDYQRIASGTFPADYATTSTITGQPFRPYLLFDGSDDCLFTASVDYSSSDEMTVAASISKRSDAAQGTVVELSSTSTNAGAFGLLAPLSTGGANDNFTFRSAGATTWSDAIGTSYVAPTTRVVVGQGDISADQSILRVDKAQVATSATDQGAGNYTNAAMFIGRRNNSSQPLSAWLYVLIVRGKTCTAGEVAAVETYLAGKAGLTL